MPKLFRTLPPLPLVERVATAFGLTNLEDTTWFSKQSLMLPKLEELLPELEPYYIPCKAKEFIHPPLTQARGLTILRQLFHIHELHLTAAERTCAGVKGMWYQIAPTAVRPSGEVVISFQ